MELTVTARVRAISIGRSTSRLNALTDLLDLSEESDVFWHKSRALKAAADAVARVAADRVRLDDAVAPYGKTTEALLAADLDRSKKPRRRARRLVGVAGFGSTRNQEVCQE